MIAFIDTHREVYGVEPICNMLPIAPSTYRAYSARRSDPARAPARVRRDAVLRNEIERVWSENFGVYGVRKVWRQLRRDGVRSHGARSHGLCATWGLRALSGARLRRS